MHFYRRNLPHIEEFDATYFVTFRVWNYPYLPPAARSIALQHCLFENGRRIELHACVIMPTHVHLLFTALEDERGYPFSLAEIMKGIKGASARNINKLLKRRGQLWQDESFDRIMRAGEFQDKLEYIIANPINAGLANRPGQYKWVWLQKIAQAGVPVPQNLPRTSPSPNDRCRAPSPCWLCLVAAVMILPGRWQQTLFGCVAGVAMDTEPNARQPANICID